MICNGPKRPVFVSGGLELLQMVSEPDTGSVLARTLDLKRVDCELPHRLERRIKHSL